MEARFLLEQTPETITQMTRVAEAIYGSESGRVGNLSGVTFQETGEENGRDTSILAWGIGKIRIRGPKADIFFDKFANQQATSVRADGKDILSVTMQLNSDEAAEKAFEEISTLTDEDFDIETRTFARDVISAFKNMEWLILWRRFS